MAQVCLSCPGVCVRHWFGVGAFAWCEYFLGSCVFFPGVEVLLSARLSRQRPMTGHARGVQVKCAGTHWLSVGTPGAEPELAL